MENLTPAEKMYQNHLKNVSNYQKKNPEKMKIKCLRYNEKIRSDPEKYEELKQKKKEYYLNVVKPKNEEKKRSKQQELNKINNNE